MPTGDDRGYVFFGGFGPPPTAEDHAAAAAFAEQMRREQGRPVYGVGSRHPIGVVRSAPDVNGNVHVDIGGAGFGVSHSAAASIREFAQSAQEWRAYGREPIAHPGSTVVFRNPVGSPTYEQPDGTYKTFVGLGPTCWEVLLDEDF